MDSIAHVDLDKSVLLFGVVNILSILQAAEMIGGLFSTIYLYQKGKIVHIPPIPSNFVSVDTLFPKNLLPYESL